MIKKTDLNFPTKPNAGTGKDAPLERRANLQDREMNARLTLIENAIPDISEALANIQTALGTFDRQSIKNLATRADLISEASSTQLAISKLQLEIKRVEVSLIKWLIMTIVVFGSVTLYLQVN